MLLARPHRYEEAGITLENEAHLVGDEVLQEQRGAHVALVGCATVAAAAEWLHGNAAAWAWAAGAAGLATMPLPLRRPRVSRPAPAAIPSLRPRRVLLCGAGRRGGSPPVHPRTRHRWAARGHHTILRVARGPAPDAGRGHGGGQRAARCRARRAGSGPRRERAVRAGPWRGAAVLRPAPRTAHERRLRFLPHPLRPRPDTRERATGAALAGRRAARRPTRRHRARRSRARPRPAPLVRRRAGRPVALARGPERGVERGARTPRLAAVGGALLPGGVLPPVAGRVQRVGRSTHGARDRAVARGGGAVAPPARASLVERGRRRPLGDRRPLRGACHPSR